MDEPTETKHLPKSDLGELFQYVDRNQANATELLKKAVAIPTVSQDEKYFPEITKMLELCQAKLEDAGATTELVESKSVRTPDGGDYPPILFADLLTDEELKTVCVYGHVDTLMINSGDHSQTDVLNMRVKGGKMHGPGVSVGKGPLLCWLNAVKIYVSSKFTIPVNLKFIIDGIAELHSLTLEEVLTRKQEFFIDIDYICLMTGKKVDEVPCLRYGHRGVCHFSLNITCGERDIDSGEYAGAFDQPLFDAVRVVSSLMDKHDKLVVPNILKDVVAPTFEEKEIIENDALNVEELKKKLGVRRLRHKEIPSRLVIHKSWLPSVSVHAFETSMDYENPKNYAMIPCRTVVKFSINLVPKQKALSVGAHVENHLKKVWKQTKSANDYKLTLDLAIDPWKEDPTDMHFKAAEEAIKMVYGKEPSCICDGRSLAAASILKSIAQHCSSLVLSLSEPSEHAHEEEAISVSTYMNNIKLIMAYMCYIHEL